MRNIGYSILLVLTLCRNAAGQPATPFNVPNRGVVSLEIFRSGSAITTGSVRAQLVSGQRGPAGMAIFALRQNGVLVSEATVPASARLRSGRIYAELTSTTRTGVAFANPNTDRTTVRFYFTSDTGENFGQGTMTVAGNGQVARFLNEFPFNGLPGLTGSFTFESDLPVAVTALRGLTSENGEFLVTTLPVADLASPPASELYLPHYADGGGWTTTVLMLNPTDVEIAGSLTLFAPSGAVAPGGTDYRLAPRSSLAVRIEGGGGAIRTGWMRIAPAAGSTAPGALAIFSFKAGGITVTEAAVPAAVSGTAFRLFAEAMGKFSQSEIGSFRTGVAIANPASVAAMVSFELTTTAGAPVDVRGAATVPARGHTALFLDQIPGLESMRVPFKGVLRVSTTSAAGIAVTGLRGRYNERGDFLITTTAPANENDSAAPADIFPHIAFGGGYVTTLVLFSGNWTRAPTRHRPIPAWLSLAPAASSA